MAAKVLNTILIYKPHKVRCWLIISRPEFYRLGRTCTKSPINSKPAYIYLITQLTSPHASAHIIRVTPYYKQMTIRIAFHKRSVTLPISPDSPVAATRAITPPPITSHDVPMPRRSFRCMAHHLKKKVFTPKPYIACALFSKSKMTISG